MLSKNLIKKKIKKRVLTFFFIFMKRGKKVTNLKLKSIAVYHGEMVVGNDYYVEHFAKQGKDVEHFLSEIIGRKRRYMIDSTKENSLTMALTAVESALKKADLTGEDIDMIIYSACMPEYVVPPSSIHVHNAINGKKQCICFDINAVCAGMTVSLDMINRYMQSSDLIKRALIVGADYVNILLNQTNEFCYGHYGDASCAIILEKTDEACGIIGSKCYVNSCEHNNILFPGCGTSNIPQTEDKEKWRLNWIPFENVSLERAYKSMTELLDENNLTVDDIKMFCFSQYALSNVKTLREMLGIGEERSIFIGDEYGYTGTSSPFIALYESIEKGFVKRGDHVMFWTIGAGSQNIALLFKY